MTSTSCCCCVFFSSSIGHAVRIVGDLFGWEQVRIVGNLFGWEQVLPLLLEQHVEWMKTFLV